MEEISERERAALEKARTQTLRMLVIEERRQRAIDERDKRRRKLEDEGRGRRAGCGVTL